MSDEQALSIATCIDNQSSVSFLEYTFVADKERITLTSVRPKRPALWFDYQLISKLSDGFLGKKIYAIKPAIRFPIKFSNDRCLVCSI